MKTNTLVAAFFLIFSAMLVHAQTDSIRDKVEERVKSTKNIGTAYIGTITDILENSIQINKQSYNGDDEPNQILQIATTENTSFAKSTKSVETLEFGDLAIGDFVLGMGFVDDNKVLTANRVVVTSVPEKTTRQALLGTIVGTSASTFTIETKEGQQVKVDPLRGAEYTTSEDGELKDSSFSDIVEGKKVIVSGEFDEELLARIIHLVE